MQKAKRNQKGEGVVEYGFVIAFVGVLIAIAFNLTQGGLFSGISGSYSSISGNLIELNKASNPSTVAGNQQSN